MKRALNTQEIISAIELDSQADSVDMSDVPEPRLVLVASPLPSTSLPESESEGRNGFERPPAACPADSLESSSSTDNVIDISNDEDEETVTTSPTPVKRQRFEAKGKGRSLDPVWKEFTIIDTHPDNPQCNTCGEFVSNKVERLRKHFYEKCKGPKQTSSNSTAVNRNQRSSANSAFLKPNVPKPLSVVPTPPKSKAQGKITGHLDILRQSEKTKLDKEVASYIYGTNLPFSHVENPLFVRFLKQLKPSYVPPSRKSVGGKLLNNAYEETMAQHRDNLNGKYVTIMQDGWATQSREAVIAHSITTGEKSYFINAIPPGEQEKTAEYCANLLLTTMDNVTTELGVKVIAVVTDNCNAMNRMREHISITHPGVFTFGCHSHLLNLLGSKLTPRSLQNKVEIVQGFFRNHDKPASALKSKNGTRPVLPAATRWNSWIDCFESYLKNQTKYLEISRQDDLKVDFSTVIPILNDPELFAEVKQTVDYLKPIQLALDEVQKEGSSLADGVFCWIDLKKKFTFTNGEIKAYFKSQFETAVTGVGLAAYLLHPKYRGEGVSTQMMSLAQSFLERENPFAVIIAAQLNQKNDLYFPAIMFKDEVINKCSASTWWSSQAPYGKVQPNVIELCMRLMSLPATSAGIERHFSTLGSIMTDRRNSLGVEKAGKLCTVYKSLAGSIPPTGDGDDWEDDKV